MEHLVGRVLYAGGLAEEGNTEDTGGLQPSDLGGGGSSLWEDAQDEPPGSMEAPFPCRALEVWPSDSLQDRLVLPWKEKNRHTSVATKPVPAEDPFLSLPCSLVWSQPRPGPWGVNRSEVRP